MVRLLVNLTQDRVTGEKETNCNSRAQEVSQKWDLSSGQSRQLLYFVDNKTICEESTGQINLGFRYSTSKESKLNLYPG